jgi:putative glutamine amidotransferase
MSKPKILIPIPVQDAERRRFALGRNYVRSVIAAGGAPVLLPTELDTDSAYALYQEADGVLLSGGGDVDPAIFGEEKHEKTGETDVDRDRVELALARWAVADNKPIFGICRGVQVINVALGGSLVQDVPSQRPSALMHPMHWLEESRRDDVHHTVCVHPNTLLGGITGFGEVGVNSFHHQAVSRVAPDFIVSAEAPDGIVEAIELSGHAFCLGVQWHPEEMSASRPDMQRLFDALVRASTS